MPDPSPPAIAIEPDRGAARLRLRWAIGIAALGVALYLVHRSVAAVGWDDVRRRLASAHWSGLALAALCVLAHLYFWGWRWRLAIRRVDPLPRCRVIYAALAAAASVNLIAPFARVLGGLLRAQYVSRSSPLSFASAYGIVLFDQLAHLAVMAMLTGAALITGAALAGQTALALALGVALAVALGGALFWEERLTAHGPVWLAAWLEERAARGHGLLSRLLDRGREALQMFARLLADRSLRFQAVALGLAIFLANVLAQTAVFWALDARASLPVIVVSIALGTVAGTLAGTPGGLGAAEAAMIALYVALRVDRLDAAAAALLYRAVHYCVVLGTGLPAAAWLEWEGRRASRGLRAPR